MDFGTILGGTAGMSVAIVATIKFIVTREFKQIEKNDEELKIKIANAEKQISDLRLEISKGYVAKDEFLRSTNSLEVKLDKVQESITDLAVKIEKRGVK